jgi:hypothetical protein
MYSQKSRSNISSQQPAGPACWAKPQNGLLLQAMGLLAIAAPPDKAVSLAPSWSEPAPHRDDTTKVSSHTV